MKYQKVLLIIALTAALMFSGCGTEDSSSADTNTSAASETTEQTAENTLIGSITEITKTELICRKTAAWVIWSLRQLPSLSRHNTDTGQQWKHGRFLFSGNRYDGYCRN